MVNRFFKVIFFAFALLLPLNGITQEQKLSFENQLIDAVENNNASIVRLLLQQGADPNSTGRFKTTALHRAAFNNYGNIADILIASGADLNAQDLGGATPLHIATRQGNTEVVAKLIQAGANPNIKDNEGYSSINKASASRNEAVINALSGNFQNSSELTDPLINNSLANKEYIQQENKSQLQPVQVEESFDNLISPTSADNLGVTQAIPPSAPRVIDLANGNNSYEIPAVVLPNSERAKMGGNITPQANNLESQQNLLLDDLAKENLALEANNNLENNQAKQEYLNNKLQEQRQAIVNQNLPQNNQMDRNINEEVFSDKEVQIGFYPVNMPPQEQFNNTAPQQPIQQDYSKPASFAYTEIARKQVFETTNYDSPKFSETTGNINVPEFNYQKYKPASGLFTMPVSSLQVVRINDKGFIKESKYQRDITPKTYPSARNYDTNDYSSVRKEYYDMVGLPRSLMSPEERRRTSILNNNYRPQYTQNYNKNDIQENLFEAPAAPVYNQMKAVPVAEVQIDGEVMERRPVASNVNWQNAEQLNSNNLIDETANQILSEPASGQNILPSEFNNLPRDNNFDRNQLASNIQTFYNNDGSYDVSYNLDDLEAKRVRNLEISNRATPNLAPSADINYGADNAINRQVPDYNSNYNGNFNNNSNINIPKSMAGRMPIQTASPQASYRQNTDFERSEYPTVQGNFARGPKSIQFWRAIPEERKGQVYSRIIQQNAPVISPVRKVEKPINSYASRDNLGQDILETKAKTEEVRISVEPVKEVENQEQNWQADVSYAENKKVPNVEVAEETMPELDAILSESENIPEPPMPDEVFANEDEIPAPSKNPEEAPKLPQEKIEANPSSDNQNNIPELSKIEEPNLNSASNSNQNNNATYDYSAAASDNDLSGTHAVIGIFDSAQQAVEYFNKISLRLGLLYNYKIVQSASSNKFMLAVGKLEDEVSANKVCEVYSSSEASCQALVDQKIDSPAIRDFSIVESKKVYSMIGEFVSEDETRKFFQTYSNKFNVDYKIVQSPDNNIYLLQVGPLFNGGDGKIVCDEMTAPNIKCRVTLK